MQVKEIKKLKSGKYKIKIDDNTITTYDDVILKNKLLYNREVDHSSYEQIELDSEYYDIYYRAVNHILRKLRSTLEIRAYLEKMDVPDVDQEKIVSKLLEAGLLNDQAYIKAYISDSFYLSGDGPYKIQNYLLSQELDEVTIEDEISKLDNGEIQAKLKKIIDKKIKNDNKHSSYQLKQKIILDMTNLGYSKDMICEILDGYELQDNIKMQKEYEKLYQKYYRRLDEKELFIKIKEKLYSKGFDINEIQAFINKKRMEQ